MVIPVTVTNVEVRPWKTKDGERKETITLSLFDNDLNPMTHHNSEIRIAVTPDELTEIGGPAGCKGKTFNLAFQQVLELRNGCPVVKGKLYAPQAK